MKQLEGSSETTGNKKQGTAGKPAVPPFVMPKVYHFHWGRGPDVQGSWACAALLLFKQSLETVETSLGSKKREVGWKRRTRITSPREAPVHSGGLPTGASEKPTHRWVPRKKQHLHAYTQRDHPSQTVSWESCSV